MPAIPEGTRAVIIKGLPLVPQLSGARLPSTLVVLKLTSVGLELLPDLPPQLRHLDVSRNRLPRLPLLPDGLQILLAQENQLENSDAIGRIPPALQSLDLSGNDELADLDLELPDGLQVGDDMCTLLCVCVCPYGYACVRSVRVSVSVSLCVGVSIFILPTS